MQIITITGTVLGAGYRCKYNNITSIQNLTTDEEWDNSDGIWNNVSYHVPWIRQQAMVLHEELKNCRSDGVTGI